MIKVHTISGAFVRCQTPPEHFGKKSMNTIIYIVGLVVIIGVILSYFGFR